MVVRYYRELLNHFTRLLKDRDGAADLVQEAYVRVLSMQQSGKLITQPRALLFHTARNLLIDRHRRSEVRAEVSQAEDADAELENLTAPRASEPEAAAESAQAVEVLLRAIEGLPLRCREAFVLHRFDGFSHAEVAARMGISCKMVEQHIKHAMDVCRRCKAEMDTPSEYEATPPQ